MSPSSLPSLPRWIARQLPDLDRSMVDVGGRAMHVMQRGDGRPVLMVHGNPTWGFLWRKVVAALEPLPCRVIVPDLIGLGLSEKPPGHAHTLAAHVGWMAGLIRALDLRDVVLVVQDWGGAIGAGAFRDQRDRLGGMVVLNTVLGPPKPGFRPTGFHRLAHAPVLGEALFRGLNFPARGMWLAQGDRRSITRDAAAAYRWPLRDRRHNVAPLALARMVPDRFEHPSVPVLAEVAEVVDAFEGPASIVWGDRDPVLGRVKRRIARALPQADVVSTQAGHFLQEEVPGPIAAAIRRVLDAPSR